MKLLLSIISLIFITYPLTAKTIICGHINDDQPDNIEIAIPVDHYFNHGSIFSSTAGNNFKFILDIDRPRFILLRYKNRMKRMFVHQNDSLFISLNILDKRRTIKFSGKGSNDNNFLTNYENKFNYKTRPVLLDPEKIIDYGIKYQNERLKFLNDNSEKLSLSKEFITAMKYQIKYSSMVLLSLYYCKNDDRYKSDSLWAAYYRKAMSLEKISNDSALVSFAYHEYLYQFQVFYKMRFLNEGFDEMFEGKTSIYEIRERVIRNNFNNKTLESALLSLLFDAIYNCQEEEIILRLYNNFRTQYPGNYYLTLIEGKLSSRMNQFNLNEDRSLTQQHSVDQTSNRIFVDYSNLSLKDFFKPYRGRPVYVDFWATWCAPCVVEFRYHSDLKNHFRNTDLLFMYVSLDEEDKTVRWKEMISRYDLKGINILIPNGFQSKIAKELNIQGIPRYVIIDKNGDVVNENALRPSNLKKLILQIEQYL